MHSQAARRVFSKVMQSAVQHATLPPACSPLAGACPSSGLGNGARSTLSLPRHDRPRPWRPVLLSPEAHSMCLRGLPITSAILPICEGVYRIITMMPWSRSTHPSCACIAQARRAAVRSEVRIMQAAYASALDGAEKVPLSLLGS